MSRPLPGVKDDMSGNNWFDENAVTILVAIISVIATSLIAYMLYKYQSRDIQIGWYSRTFEIASPSTEAPEVQFRYSDSEVKRIAVTRFAVFNKGNGVVLGSDIAARHPLRIIGNENLKLLDVTVTHSRSIASDFECTLNRAINDAKITFDHLNKHDGAVIRVVHDGTRTEAPKVIGAIRSAGEIKESRLNSTYPPIGADFTLFPIVLIPGLYGVQFIIEYSRGESGAGILLSGISIVALSIGVTIAMVAKRFWWDAKSKERGLQWYYSRINE